MYDQTAAVLLLLASGLLGLALIPFGLPGLWVILLGMLGYGWLTDFRTVGMWTLVVAIALALVGELIEAWAGFRFARRYGGSRRAGWGALLGGLIGAVIGVPVPVVGSVVGGFVGAFAGATLFEYSAARRSEGAVRAGWGAVLGRAVAVGVKMGIGIMLVALSLWSAVRG
jgi:uncharacterized protein YqgC (DUF456 family)